MAAHFSIQDGEHGVLLHVSARIPPQADEDVAHPPARVIRELLTRGGKATVRDIAAAFLARDESQLEYYEKITKDMHGKVLAKHGVVKRHADQYRLTI
jgi:hypothetical protein